MNVVAAQTDVSIGAILAPTLQAFYPLLVAHQAEIESVKRKMFKYGATDRHQLDVFYPTGRANGKAPILFFVYGGGFDNGHRVFDPPFDLIYRNVGAFFAKLGIFLVIADYRLVPTAKFPDSAEDEKDAVSWLINNADEVNKESDLKLDIDNIFFMGHSAGAAHVSTMMLVPGLLPPDVRSHIRGLILLGGAYSFRGPVAIHAEALTKYYGTEAKMREREALGLLERAPEDLVKGLPDILFSKSEREPEFLHAINADFLAALKAKLGRPKAVKEDEMAGHNHVSPFFALNSGEGEEWALRVEEWIKTKAG